MRKHRAVLLDPAAVGTAIDWWHDLQGGVIAQERPPPPGVTDDYPNLGTVPPRPTPTDAATRRALSARLAADRNRTELLATQDPITPASRAGAAAPAAPAMAETAPPSRATMEAASAPPPPYAPPVAAAPAAPAAFQAAAAPVPPPRATANAAPRTDARARAPAGTAQPGPVPDLPDAPPAPAVSGPVPPLPTTPPAMPNLAGIPASAAAPATPRPAPQVDVQFLPNSSVLRPESDAALRALATRRGGGPVALLGGGDAASVQTEAQAAALPLAWRRARAMADVLAAAGVPAAAMRIDAAALGRGGTVRLVQ